MHVDWLCVWLYSYLLLYLHANSKLGSGPLMGSKSTVSIHPSNHPSIHPSIHPSMILGYWIVLYKDQNCLYLSELWSKLQRTLRMLPTLWSGLVWHSSLFSIKLIPLVVLFLRSTICSTLELGCLTSLFLITGSQFPWCWSIESLG